jgi:putative ABC transport system permease protein
MAEQLWPNEMRGALSERSKAVFLGVGRLKSGIGQAQAQANIAAIASSLAREYPEANEGHTATVGPLTDAIYGSTGRSPILFAGAVLLAVVGIVLLIACSNCANLMLARSAARQQEIAVRLAIGASRSRLVRQLLTESVVLGLMSGVVGLLIGYAGSQFLWSFLPSEVSANLIRPKMDATVIVLCVVTSALIGVLFGMIPALRASRTSVAETLKEEARTSGRNRRRITVDRALLVGQVAFSFLSLVTAALFLRSIERAYEIDPGFQTRNLALFLMNPGQAGYQKAQVKAFYKEVRNRVATLPGVESVSWASNLPLWGRSQTGLQVEGFQQKSKADTITTVINAVDLDFFETVGIAVENGREFIEHDREDSTPVAIVNEKLAHDYWPNASALGKRIQLPGETFMRQIAGVAKNAKLLHFRRAGTTMRLHSA